MHGITDKKRWWAAHCCKTVTPVHANRSFDVLAPIGMIAVMLMVVALGSAIASSGGTAGYAAAGLLPIPVTTKKLSVMEKLERFLRRNGNPNTFLFNDPTAPTIDGLREQALDLSTQMARIQQVADQGGRGLTPEEITMIDQLEARFNSTIADVDRRTRIAAATDRISTGGGRQTEPGNTAGTRHYGEGARTRPNAENDERRFGFVSFGEFGRAVLHASKRGAQNIDPRLIANAAPTTASTEGVSADGGFLVPPDFRATIMEKVEAEDDLFSRTDKLTTTSNSITIPVDETTPWDGTGGLLAYWAAELAAATQSKVALQNMTTELHKIIALCPVSDELIADAGTLTGYLNRKVPSKIAFKVSDAIITGNGAGKPLGILASGGPKVTVDKESGQNTTNPLVFANITKMYARLYKACRRNAVWLINQDLEPSLYGLQFPGAGTAVPVFLPPGGLSSSPFATLFGKPIIPTESCQTIGTEGDIILTDLSAYMTLVKTEGLRQDVSIHMFFDTDATAFRFVLRVGGKPWWKTAINPKNGSQTRTCTVTLQTR